MHARTEREREREREHGSAHTHTHTHTHTHSHTRTHTQTQTHAWSGRRLERRFAKFCEVAEGRIATADFPSFAFLCSESVGSSTSASSNSCTRQFQNKNSLHGHFPINFAQMHDSADASSADSPNFAKSREEDSRAPIFPNSAIMRSESVGGSTSQFSIGFTCWFQYKNPQRAISESVSRLSEIWRIGARGM